MSKPKYRGKLARPITPGLVELVQHGDFESWAKSNRVKQESLSRMSDLLEHYQIDPSSPNCWFILAFELASDHVPGFQVKLAHRRPGRPKKSKNPSPKKKRKPGRPTKHAEEDAVELVRIVDGYKKQLEDKQDRRVTDKETLKQLITSYAKNEKENDLSILYSELPRYQKMLSKARKKIPKSTKK